MKTKTYFKTFLILAVMSVLFIPAAVFAIDDPEDCNLWIGGHEVTETGYVTGDGIEGEVYYDDEARTLTLCNATITGLNNVVGEDYGTNDSNIYFKDFPLIIQYEGENNIGTVKDTDIGIDAADVLVLKGNGIMNISSSWFCIWADKDLRCDEAILSLYSKGNSCIYGSNCVKFDDSFVGLESDGYEAIYAKKSILIYSSTVLADSVNTAALESLGGDISIIDSYVGAEASFSVRYSGSNAGAINADNGKIKINRSFVYAVNDQDGSPAMMAKGAISVSHSDFIDPSKAKVGQYNGQFVVLDSKGNVASKVRIDPNKLPATMGAAGKTATLKSGAKKLKKNKTISKAKAYTVLNARGDVTYSKVKANKCGSKFKVDKKTGKITVKKGLKNGTYKLTVKVTDAGDYEYYGTSKNVVVTIKVRK